MTEQLRGKERYLEDRLFIVWEWDYMLYIPFMGGLDSYGGECIHRNWQLDREGSQRVTMKRALDVLWSRHDSGRLLKHSTYQIWT